MMPTPQCQDTRPLVWLTRFETEPISTPSNLMRKVHFPRGFES
jgi:hypothetical protein